MLSTDPIDIAIDPVTGDITATGPLTLTSGLTGVVQAARIRMQMVAGEWFLNLDFGVPLFERSGVPASRALFAQKFDTNKAVAMFREALLGNAFMPPVPGVVAIQKLSVTFDGPSRAATINWQVKTAFGDTPADTLVVGN